METMTDEEYAERWKELHDTSIEFEKIHRKNEIQWELWVIKANRINHIGFIISAGTKEWFFSNILLSLSLSQALLCINISDLWLPAWMLL